MVNKKRSTEERVCTCLYCGKFFSYYGKGAPRKFCNDSCRISYYGNNSKNPRVERTYTCLGCGKTFLDTSRGGNRKFCTDVCREKYYGTKPKEVVVTEKVCKYCGKTFACSKSTPTKIFCSPECTTAFHKEKQQSAPKKKIYQENHTCQYCGKEFIWTSSKSYQKYCSSECATNANNERLKAYKWKEERKCAYCGNSFEWHSNKSGQKYCSQECRDAATKITIHNYQKKIRKQKTDEELQNEVYLKVLNIISKMDQTKGASFGGKAIDYRVIGDISERTREEVLERDSHECQVCKRKDSLHLHHLIKRKNGGNHDAENLITLCASCHRHIETGDLDHAVRKCFRNAKKYYGNDDGVKKVDIDGLKFQLTTLFNKLKESPIGEDTEIMVCLDEALDLLDID